MIRSEASFLKFYLDENKHHLNVPSPIRHSEVVTARGGQSIGKAEAADLKLHLNKLRLAPLDRM